MKGLLITDLEKTRQYTIAVAEALAEEHFDFKPANNVRTFRELIDHLAYSLFWMDENYIQQIKTEWQPPTLPKGKKELLSYLKNSFDALEKSVHKKNQWSDEDVRNFYFVIEHNAHHRGQAVTYLRCCNTIPPEFPF